MRKILMVLIVLTAILINSGAFAAVNDDQVTSQKIKEADGTSGQNTNSGSGVKTGHIQDGAVTDAKIGGTISQSKVTGLEAALVGKSDVTHNHDNLYQQKYGKIAIVAQTGGDYADPVSALNAIATWCGTPSATNPCLMKLMPGVYDIGSNSLLMLSYVDIEGSGERTTVITSNSAVGTVQGSRNAELRFLTINGLGGLGISNNNADLSLTNVSVNVAGSGWITGIKNIMSPLTLNKVSVTVAQDSPWYFLRYRYRQPSIANGYSK